MSPPRPEYRVMWAVLSALSKGTRCCKQDKSAVRPNLTAVLYRKMLRAGTVNVHCAVLAPSGAQGLGDSDDDSMGAIVDSDIEGSQLAAPIVARVAQDGIERNEFHEGSDSEDMLDGMDDGHAPRPGLAF